MQLQHRKPENDESYRVKGTSVKANLRKYLPLSMGGAIVVGALGAMPGFAACPDTGIPVVVREAGTVTATFVYVNPATLYSDDLYLVRSPSDQFLFNNKTSQIGDQVVLGPYQAGDELKFRMRVNDTGLDYFTGASELNPDNLPHTELTPEGNGLRIAFEDLFGLPECPDGSFTDLVFSFSNVTAKFTAPDRFVSFRATPRATNGLPTTVTVRDQFTAPGGQAFNLSSPFLLAVPAAKPRETVKSPSITLTAYRYLNTVTPTPVNLRSISSLGRIRITTGKPDRLLMPSSYSRTSVPAVPDIIGKGIVDPLNCYNVSYRQAQFDRQIKKTIRLRTPLSKKKTYSLVAPSRFCTPATVDRAFTPNRSDTYMLCFSAQPADGIPSKRVPNIFVTDALGQATLKTVRDREVCVPTTITPL